MFCTDSAPADAERCVDPAARATVARLSIAVVTSDDERNHDPVLVDPRLGDAPFAASDDPPDPGAPCDAADGLAVLTAGGSPVMLTVGATANSLEPQLDALTGEPTTEALQVGHQATAGGFEPAFSFIDAPGAVAEVAFTPPPARDVPADGLTVRLWHVAVDGRGGTDWIERSACVRP